MATTDTTTEQPTVPGLTIWVLESHFVGNETAPSARLFASEEAALQALAEDDATQAAEAAEIGWDYEPQFSEPQPAQGGGWEWGNEDGDWQTLLPMGVVCNRR